ncbi:unnamed protein product, partial [Discosporangium mesarthrocarpum]
MTTQEGLENGGVSKPSSSASLSASGGGGAVGDGSEPQENVQETLSKFKRLLSLARRSIEENQRQIAEKDAQLTELREVLDAAEEVQRRGAGTSGSDPLRVLRRVREGGMWWLLVEYDDEYGTQGWTGVSGDKELQDFANRGAGEPLKIPPVSLSPEESATVLEDARKQVASIREEYRRYRVKAELARKQNDAKVRQASADSIAEKQRRIAGEDLEAQAGKTRALEEEVQRLQAELAEQDETWRHAYEKQVKETEKLKGAGGEAVLAAQWRQRYEKLSIEKADAVAKLNMLRPGGG